MPTAKPRKVLNRDKVKSAMIKRLLFFIAMLLFTGCVNERGVSLRYYNDCEEYYDAQGYYQKKCDENIVDYSDVKKALTSPAKAADPKVW